MDRPCKNYTTNHLWIVLLANTATDAGDDLVEQQAIEAHHRFNGLVKRIAELEGGLQKLGCKLIEAQTASTTGRQNDLMLEAREQIDTMLGVREKKND